MAAAATRTPYGPKSEVAYADPGYQADKKARYPLDSKAHAKSAWAYINQADNAKPYTGPQLKRIKGRIKSALRKFGVGFMAEGWCYDPPLLITEAIAEYAGMDPECAGSYSLSATNGPTTVTVCSYGLDPADLHVILAQACAAASAALCSIDPDMDGDIDVPGAEAEDDDDDAGDLANGTGLPENGDGVDSLVARLMAAIRGESHEDPEALLAEARASAGTAPAAVTETAPEEDPAPEPAAATSETEAPVTETTTTTEAAGTATAATFTQADVDGIVAAALERAEAARKARKAAKGKRQPAPAETTPAAPVTETDEQRINRIVAEKLAALTPAPAAETEDQRIARLVEEKLIAERQRLTEQGSGPGRKGLAPGGQVNEHTAARIGGEAGLNEFGLPSDWPNKPLHQFTSEELEQYANPALVRHVLKDRADLLA